MKAIVYNEYGPPDVLKMADVLKPAPKDNEVLIRVHATTVTAPDWRARSLKVPPGYGPLGRLVFGIFGPRKPILGTELAGEIEAIGKDVTKYRVGDQVFAFPDAGFGSYAEYRTMPEDGQVALKPANLSFEEAAALSFGASTALYFLRDKGKIQRGEKVLIVGASGGVGTAAVQLAKHFGAEVTGVCSTANLDLVRSIGADKAIDYTNEDFTRNGETYDIIMDTTATAPFSRCKASLKENGRFLSVLAGLWQGLGDALAPKKEGKKVIGGTPPAASMDMQFIADLAEAGEFKPFIDRTYPLEQIAEAHAYVETGRKRGNVIITVAH